MLCSFFFFHVTQFKGKRIPVSRDFLLMESVIRENFHLCDSEPGKFCLWDPKSWSSESVIHLKEFGIPLTIAIRNPERGVQSMA